MGPPVTDAVPSTAESSAEPSAGTSAESPGETRDSRRRLVAAAVAAFAEKGFHGTTTRDIAAAAGMSPAALYVHHRSKEELLHLISLAGHHVTLDLIRAAVASAPGPTAQLRALVHDFAAHHARDHTKARIVNYELHALRPDHLEEVRELRHAIDAEVRRVIDAGIAAGEFDVPDAGMVSTAILSLGIDIARWYREEGSWTPETIADQYADLVLRMVRARDM